LKSLYVTPTPNTKIASSSCQSCTRLIQIEGEKVCFREGSIFRLIPVEQIPYKLNLLCEGWQAIKR
jgi:hypothetical protein